MADPKKLTRAEVYKQIDAFRGIERDTTKKPSPEQCTESRRARNGKTMKHGWIRIRVG